MKRLTFTKVIGVIVFIVVALALLIVAVDALGVRSVRARAQTIRAGDTKQQVERVLGRPVTIFQPDAISAQAHTNWVAAALSVPSETWAYGRRLELRHSFSQDFPYFYPFRLRLFGPDSDDVAIRFDTTGIVTKVIVPSVAE